MLMEKTNPFLETMAQHQGDRECEKLFNPFSK